jgi:DNA-binding XRE family transcriptional regulator
MKNAKKKKLEAAGWRTGGAKDFLDLDATEAALVTIRVSLAEGIRIRRKAAGLTQAQLAKQASTTQARVAKAENANPEVSIDLCMRILLTLGANPKKIAKAIAA